MSIHYKFKSAISYDTITFDGLHISVRDLKKAILHQKHIGKSPDFDLQITNAQSNEVYTDESTLIPKNSSLIVVRIPLTAQQRKAWEKPDYFQYQFNNKGSENSDILNKFAKSVDLTAVDASEEDKIQAAIAQSTLDYDPSNYVRIKGSNQVGELPPNYRCYKCLQPGHWIKDCKFNLLQQENALEIRKSTGIPRSFMVLVDGPEVPGAMMTPSGHFAIPNIDHEARKEANTKKSSEPPVVIETPSIPDDLKCGVCKDLLTDAVMIPCCGDSFCDECIRNLLLESDEHECPACKENNVSPNTLIPSRFLRNCVNNFKNQTGYSRKAVTKQLSVAEPPVSKEQPCDSTSALAEVAAETTQPTPAPHTVTPPNLVQQLDLVTETIEVKDDDDEVSGNAIPRLGDDIPSMGMPIQAFYRTHNSRPIPTGNPMFTSQADDHPHHSHLRRDHFSRGRGGRNERSNTPTVDEHMHMQGGRNMMAGNFPGPVHQNIPQGMGPGPPNIGPGPNNMGSRLPPNMGPRLPSMGPGGHNMGPRGGNIGPPGQQNMGPGPQNLPPRPQNMRPGPQNMPPRPQNMVPGPQNMPPRPNMGPGPPRQIIPPHLMPSHVHPPPVLHFTQSGGFSFAPVMCGGQRGGEYSNEEWHYRGQAYQGRYSRHHRPPGSSHSVNRPNSPPNGSHHQTGDAMDVFLNKLKDKESRKAREKRRSRSFSSSYSRSRSRSRSRGVGAWSRSPPPKGRSRSPRQRSLPGRAVKGRPLKRASSRSKVLSPKPLSPLTRLSPKGYSPRSRPRSRSPRPSRRSRTPLSRSRSRSPRPYTKRRTRSRSRSYSRSSSLSVESVRSYGGRKRDRTPPPGTSPCHSPPIRSYSRYSGKSSETSLNRIGGTKTIPPLLKGIPPHLYSRPSEYSSMANEYSRYAEKHDNRYPAKEKVDRSYNKRYDDYNSYGSGKDWERVRDEEIKRRRKENEKQYEQYNVEHDQDSIRDRHKRKPIPLLNEQTMFDATEVKEREREKEKDKDKIREGEKDSYRDRENKKDKEPLRESKEVIVSKVSTDSKRLSSPDRPSKSPDRKSRDKKKKKREDSDKKKKKKKVKEKLDKKDDEETVPPVFGEDSVRQKDRLKLEVEPVSKSDDLYEGVGLSLNVDVKLPEAIVPTVQNIITSNVVPAEADSTAKEVMLAPVPELSKWEKDEEITSNQNEPKPVDGAGATSRSDESSIQVTSEVLKRAENAIFKKSVNPLKHSEVKAERRKESDRKEKVTNKETENVVKDVTFRPVKSIAMQIKGDQEDVRSKKSERSLGSDKDKPRISAKERLGAKIDEINSKKDSQSERRDKSEKNVKTVSKDTDPKLLFREKEYRDSRKVSLLRKDEEKKGQEKESEKGISLDDSDFVPDYEAPDNKKEVKELKNCVAPVPSTTIRKRSPSEEKHVVKKVKTAIEETSPESSDDSLESVKKHKKKKKYKKKKKKRQRKESSSDTDSSTSYSSDSDSDEKRKKKHKRKHKKLKKRKKSKK